MKYFQKKLQAIAAAKEGQQPAGGAMTGMQGSFADKSAGGGMGTSFAAGKEAQGNMGQSFAQQNKSFSRTQQGDDPNRQIMRDDYGWKMNESQYKGLEKDRGAFDKSVSDYRNAYNKDINKYTASTNKTIAAEQSRYDTFRTTFDKQYAASKAAFKAKEKEIGNLPSQNKIFSDWYAKDKMQVTVSAGPGQDQGVYWVPRTMVKHMRNEGIDGWMSDKGSKFNVNVTQGGRMRGQEMHDMLRTQFDRKSVEKGFWEQPEIQGNYRTVVDNWHKVTRQFGDAKSAWLQNVDKDQSSLTNFNYNLKRSRDKLAYDTKVAGITRDKAIGSATNARQGNIDAAAEAYQIKSAARRQAYKNLSSMRLTTDKGATNGTEQQ